MSCLKAQMGWVIRAIVPEALAHTALVDDEPPTKLVIVELRR